MEQVNPQIDSQGNWINLDAGKQGGTRTNI